MADYDRRSATYTTDTNQLLESVHKETEDCRIHGCCIHNPTDPHKDWPTHFRFATYMMERICPHGFAHPDKDSISFARRTKGDAYADLLAEHDCCGCCKDQLTFDG